MRWQERSLGLEWQSRVQEFKGSMVQEFKRVQGFKGSMVLEERSLKFHNANL